MTEQKQEPFFNLAMTNDLVTVATALQEFASNVLSLLDGYTLPSGRVVPLTEEERKACEDNVRKVAKKLIEPNGDLTRALRSAQAISVGVSRQFD